MKFTAQQIADFIGGIVEGDVNSEVTSFAKIEEAKQGDLCFLANMKYESFAYTTEASILILPSAFEPSKKIKATLIKVEDSYAAFAKLLTFANSFKERKKGFSDLAFISPTAKVDQSCYVGEFSVIQSNCEVGENTQIYPQVFLGENVKIGKNATIYPGVKILERCEIGDNCVIHAGVVIGSDGFGFAPNEKGEYEKIPQLGNVVVEKDVEIGANTTIDRATMGSTIIKRGSKFDNLIQVAHNVIIGEHNVFAAQAGVAGSTKIGDHNMFGGQVGLAGHIKIGNNVQVAAQSGIAKDVPDNTALMGAPAIPANKYFRVYAVFKKLDELYDRVNKLERKNK